MCADGGIQGWKKVEKQDTNFQIIYSSGLGYNSDVGLRPHGKCRAVVSYVHADIETAATLIQPAKSTAPIQLQ